LILMSVGFLPAFSFILVARAWEAVALRFLVLLIVGLLLEPLAVAAIEPAPGGLLETGIAGMGCSDPSLWPRVGTTKLSSACKVSGVDHTMIIHKEMVKHQSYRVTGLADVKCAHLLESRPPFYVLKHLL
jgi:hypothetical protein